MAEPTNKTQRMGVYLPHKRIAGLMSSSGNITYTDSSETTTKVWSNTFTGRKNPKYRAQIRAVVDATTPADGSKKTVIWKPYRFRYTGWTNRLGAARSVSVLPNFWQYYREGDCAGFPFGLTSFIDDSDPGGSTQSADNLAIERLNDQLQSFTQSVQTGEDIGEARQTINALRSPLPGIRRVITSGLERHIDALKSPSKHLPKALADAYLETVFGWNPLAASVAGVIVGMQNREEFAIYKPFSAYGGALDTSSKINTTSSGVAGISISATGWRRAKTTVNYKGIWSSSVTVPRREVQDVLGLRGHNILPTVWNLIPYSFLIDYVTNIGSIVSSLSTPWDDVRWCCKTVRREYVCSLTLTPSMNIGPNGLIESQSLSPGSLLTSSTSFSRRSQVLQPIPRPEFTGLRDMSGKRWTNVAALILSRLPIVNLLTKKAVAKDPGLPQSFIREMAYRRPNKKEGISFTFG